MHPKWICFLFCPWYQGFSGSYVFLVPVLQFSIHSCPINLIFAVCQRPLATKEVKLISKKYRCKIVLTGCLKSLYMDDNLCHLFSRLPLLQILENRTNVNPVFHFQLKLPIIHTLNSPLVYIFSSLWPLQEQYEIN